MSVDFALLKRPAGSAPKIVPLPDGNYPGVVKSYETGLKNKNGTELVRLNLALTGWPDTVSEEARYQTTGDGRKELIDLSKRQMRRDFFVTDAALGRLEKFLLSCGIEFDGVRDYESYLPEIVGAPVNVFIGHYTNDNTGKSGNQVEEITGQ
jgi:hypothetical protein